ncbi:MAG: c-type heme family protein [Terriglobia bacterium]
MRLLWKFNLLLIIVFGGGIAIAGHIAHQFLQQNAQAQVVQQARLMMGAAGAMRTYTNQQVAPLLAEHQRHVRRFLPQSVPAYGATEIFNYLRAKYPAYTYKEATLNPTNLRDRAVDWESDVIETFRNHATKSELIGQRDTPEGESLFLAHPLKVADPSCLQCHSTPSRAPAAMIAVYGKDHGFDWKAGETVGAQIVSVPMSLPVKIADHAFTTLMISLAAVALVTLILLDVGLMMIVVHPVTRLSALADEISKGNLNVPQIPVKGGDEISQLARSFNRMYLSLVKAIQMLESQ